MPDAPRDRRTAWARAEDAQADAIDATRRSVLARERLLKAHERLRRRDTAENGSQGTSTQKPSEQRAKGCCPLSVVRCPLLPLTAAVAATA